MRDTLFKRICRWLPLELRRAGYEDLRRARLTLCVAILHVLASLGWALIEGLAGHGDVLPWTFLSATLACGVILLVRSPGRVNQAARAQLALVMLALCSSFFCGVGFAGGESYILMGTIPILATSLLGCREGVSWTVASAALMTVMLLLDPSREAVGATFALSHAAAVTELPAVPGTTSLRRVADVRFVWAASIGLGSMVLLLSLLLETLRSNAVEELSDANAELVAAQKAALAANEAKVRFLSNMSHEIRTPMNSVISTTDLLARSELPTEVQDLASTACQGALSLLSLFHQLLSSTLEAGEQEAERVPCDLPEIVYGVARSFNLRASETPWVMIVDYAANAPKCFLGDPLRIRQVLLNLVGNAAKFTEHGFVRIRARNAEAPGRVRIEVEDTGIGVAQDMHERIFQRFTQGDSSTTRRYGGAGLGLAISRDLVRSMGGEIGVVSALGEGATFWFELPCDGSLGPIHTHIPRESAHVLIVEPHTAVREALEAQLQGAGVGFRSFADPRQALEVSGTPPQNGAEAPIAVLVAHDPPRMNAIEWLEERRSRELPAIVLSPHACPLDEQGRRRLGVESWLLAPAPAELVTQAIRRPAAARPARSEHDDIVLDGVRVLLVEDFVPNQKVARHILSRLGCIVDIAANGCEALEYLEKHDYDAVLMDCQMPEMDGYEATRRFRASEEQRGGHLPIIAVTANALPGDREQCLDAGMDDYVAKPIKLDTLRAALLRFL